MSSGQDWKGKRPEEVSEADEIRSQEEMKQTFGDNDPRPNTPEKGGDDLPDGSGTAVYEEVAKGDEKKASAEDGERGSVEIPASNVHASIGTDDNPAAPDMGEVVEAPLGTLAEDEVGGRPEGLGLDDAPSGGRPINGSGL